MSLQTIRQLKEIAESRIRKTYINKKSEKRKEEEKEYLKKRELFLKKHPICQAQVECKGSKAREVHHRQGRTGKNYLDVKTWLAVCHPCHIFLELNPRESKRLGLSNSRLIKAK